ncbi:uncharacterized protein LOC119607035 [Lucilia sericata]|uniref:uncharacterized protein LOC119607035 n=1 Tax=Lucilia sericata TaxID=13632 RepID=UPI0018A82119|nr:uncharacterized protein LOC119607035 [Lucilia sericata]
MEIQDEVAKLSDRISKYGKLFEDFNSLDTLKSPAQSSPKRRKSSRKIKEKQDDPQTDNNSPAQQNNPDIATTSATTRPAVTRSAVTPSAVKPTVANPFGSSLIQIPNANVIYGSEIDAASSIHNNPAPVISDTSNQLNQHNLNYAEVVTNNGINPIVNRELRVIPPKKHIFISRFAFDTSAEDINYYIKSKLNQDADISVYKFNYSQARSITSFKITVPFDIFNCVVNA